MKLIHEAVKGDYNDVHIFKIDYDYFSYYGLC